MGALGLIDSSISLKSTTFFASEHALVVAQWRLRFAPVAESSREANASPATLSI